MNKHDIIYKQVVYFQLNILKVIHVKLFIDTVCMIQQFTM